MSQASEDRKTAWRQFFCASRHVTENTATAASTADAMLVQYERRVDAFGKLRTQRELDELVERKEHV